MPHQGLFGLRGTPGWLLVWHLLFWVLAPCPVQAAALRAGFANVVITPPEGWRIAGGLAEQGSTGVLDPLQARVMVLEQGKTRAALVLCDLEGVSPAVALEARQLAARGTGIPPGNILIAATHTPAAPLYAGSKRELWHQRAVSRMEKDPRETSDYPRKLAGLLADALNHANGKMKPVDLLAGHSLNSTLSFSRRYRLRDGTVCSDPVKGSPDIAAAVGPIDPSVGLLFFVPRDEVAPLAGLISFPLPPAGVGGTKFSAGFPAQLERSLRTYFGSDYLSCFTPGACGDVSSIDYSSPLSQQSPLEPARLGDALAATVTNAFSRLKSPRRISLAVRSAVVQLALQPVSPTDISMVQKYLTEPGEQHLTVEAFQQLLKALEIQQHGGRSIGVEVQVMRLGADTVIVGLPGEPFVELGLAIQKASPFRNTLIVGLCENQIGPVPSLSAFSEDTALTRSAIVKPGSGELLVDTAVALLRELAR